MVNAETVSNMLPEWLGSKLAIVGLSTMMGYGVILMGEVDSLGAKYGVGGGIAAIAAALGIGMGKYFSNKPLTITAYANAEERKASNLASANAALIDQINAAHIHQVQMISDINKQHIATLNEAIAYHKDRADRGEVMLKASIKTKHKMSQELNRQGLLIQFWDCILTEHKIEHEAVALIDMEAVFEEEDETSKQMTLRPLVTSQLTDQALT